MCKPTKETKGIPTFYVVLVETNEPTTLYYHTRIKKPVEIFSPVCGDQYLVPVREAESGEFLAVRRDNFLETADNFRNELYRNVVLTPKCCDSLNALIRLVAGHDY